MSDSTSIITALSEYPEVWTTLLGGIVAGGIALYGQRMVLRENRKLLDDQRSETRLYLGQSILIKIIKIHGIARSMDVHFNDPQSRNLKKSGLNFAWQSIEPLVGLPSDISFKSAELSMILNLKDYDVFNSIVNIDEALRTIVNLTHMYEKEREVLLGSMEETIVRFGGNVASHELTPEQLLTLKPKIAIVNSILSQLQEFSKKIHADSEKALHSLHGLLKEKIGLESKLESIEE